MLFSLKATSCHYQKYNFDWNKIEACLPLLLLLIAIIPVIETISVIIQVAYFKKTGKRVFKMTPIHHHFELSGWTENKVVVIFSVITLIVCVIGLKII